MWSPAGKRIGSYMCPDTFEVGPDFDQLFAVEIEGLREGWDEQLICSYPTTRPTGSLEGPFPCLFVVPDQSDVIFNAGWPGPEHRLCLTECPAHLR